MDRPTACPGIDWGYEFASHIGGRQPEIIKKKQLSQLPVWLADNGKGAKARDWLLLLVQNFFLQSFTFLLMDKRRTAATGYVKERRRRPVVEKYASSLPLCSSFMQALVALKIWALLVLQYYFHFKSNRYFKAILNNLKVFSQFSPPPSLYLVSL